MDTDKKGPGTELPWGGGRGEPGVPARGTIQGDAEGAAEEGPEERGVLEAGEKST